MTPAEKTSKSARSSTLVVILVLLLLAGLPIAAWLDMRSLSDNILARQSDEISRVINDMRNFYANDVVGRLAGHPTATPTHNYRNVDGGIPIPATLSIELGKMITARNDAVRYKFVSDYPWPSRGTYELDPFERRAISELRTDPK